MLKRNPTKSHESGITLIALIITVIIIVILAAVSISAVYDSGIIGIAINGTAKYAEEQQKELNILSKTEEIIENSKFLFTPSIFITGTQISGNIYTGKVEVIIEDSASIDATGATKLWYDVTNEAGDSLISGPKDIDGRSTTVNLTEEGKYIVKAWVENEDKKSAEATKTFTIDNSVPGDPSILLTGTEGDNGYYVSEVVDVTISAGTAGSSGIRGIKYKVEGATSVPETEEPGEEVTLRITKDRRH